MADPAQRLPTRRASVGGPIDVEQIRDERRVKDAAAALLRNPGDSEARAEILRALGRPDGLAPVVDLDAERAVLSAMMIDPAAPTRLARLTVRPTPRDFWLDFHRLIARAIVTLRAKGAAVDPVLIFDELRASGVVVTPAMRGDLLELIDFTPAHHNIDAHAQIVIDCARQRRVVEAIDRARVAGYERQPDVGTWVTASTLAIVEAAGVESTNVGGTFTSNVFDGELVEPEWICRDLQLGPGRPACFAAYAGAGKTIVMQSLAVAVATGKDIWGEFSTGRPRRVLHVDLEQGHYATIKRYRRLAFAMKVTEDDLLDQLCVIAGPRLSLVEPDAERVLEELTRGYDLVLFDTLRKLLPGVDENDAAVDRFTGKLLRVSEATGRTFLAAHHTSKPSRDGAQRDGAEALLDVRGSGAIVADMGSTFRLNIEDGLVRLVHAKPAVTSEGARLDPFKLEMKDVHDGHVKRAGLLVRYVCDAEAQQRRQRQRAERDQAVAGAAVAELGGAIVALLKKTPGLSGREIAEAIPGRADRIRTALGVMLERQILVPGEKPEGKRGAGIFYRLGPRS